MKKILSFLILSILATSSVGAQELFTELQAQVTKDGPPFTFRVLGDRETGAFSAYGIHVIAPDGKEHMLDQFDAFLPDGSEVDALYVEDVNFDGYADLRIMKYLPGGANVPYFYWLFDPESQQFQESKALEVVVSPRVDVSRQELISQQRVSAAEYLTEYYKLRGPVPVMVRRDVRKFKPDGSSVLQVYEIGSDGEKLVETKNIGPEK
jgi:hypothetical protein